MDRETVLEELRAHLPHLPHLRELGVEEVAVFGSVARGEAGDVSDVDILVDFGGPPGFRRYVDVKLLLEEQLGVDGDLVSEGALREELRPQVEREAVRVA